MKIGILKTGSPPEPLPSRFGGYPEMMAKMLGDGVGTVVFDAAAGQLPDAVEDLDGLLITGSSAGVYDGAPWITRLKDYVAGLGGRVPMVGICFGHQLMAEAFGGKVEKSDRGWGLGLHRYELGRPPAWIEDPSPFVIVASHQDQVVRPPEDAVVAASSAFTPYALLDYPRRRAMSFQGHPEFTPEFDAALLNSGRGRLYSEAQADEALAGLNGHEDRTKVAGWIRRFFETA